MERSVDTVVERKINIRNSIAHMCRDIPNKHLLDADLCSALIVYVEGLGRIRRLLSYQALPDEVDLDRLHSACRIRGISVHIAKQSNSEAVEFLPMVPVHVLGHAQDLLCVVPGRAFTKKGDRIGRGGGTYDKFLASFPGIRTVGVAYPFQILDSIPTTFYDYAIQKVITVCEEFS